MIKGIIFDMDGTITLTESFHLECFVRIFNQYGITYNPSEHIGRFAGSGSPIIFRTVFKEHEKELTEKELQELVTLKRNLYTKIIQSRDIPFVKGVHEFVERIEKRGIRKIIATGNGDIMAVRYLLGKITLTDHFPDIISVTEVPRAKPFPDVFLAAAEHLKLAPGDCIVLEDSVNGVQAAQTAGMKCIAFETTTKKEALLAAGALVVIPDYTYITDAMIS